ncbi:unnamed protein product [Prorocentrum cordatum]|uniref:Uncharacterized protein n=1 Tax=Prorocentrum cordatum TaxID=2364126 RepID=A0ABN9RZR4_9DINO|nr:unnamed protein product [Polarella glacialis]
MMKKLKQQQRRLQQRCKVRAPVDRRRVLRGIRHPLGTYTAPDEIAACISFYWGPVFDSKPIFEASAKVYIEKLTKHVVLSNFPPSKRMIEKQLSLVHHSGPGPDLLPCAAWQRAPMAVDILDEVMVWIL